MGTPLKAFRICDKRHHPCQGYGAQLKGARWNSPGRPVVYTSLSYSCAMLEILVHGVVGKIPKNDVYYILEVDDNLKINRSQYKVSNKIQNDDYTATRKIGDEWLDKKETVGLIVPSILSAHDCNLLLNPLHSDFAQIKVSKSHLVNWDQRLFS